jgi:arabinose-5-phosphate isomerase
MAKQTEKPIDPALAAKIAPIRMLLMDVDGVMTDGSIIWDDHGTQTRVFHVRDGSGIYWIQQIGIKTGIISGKTCQAVSHRARELRIEEVHQGVHDKLPIYEDIKKRYGFSDAQVAYVGDDLLDLPVLNLVGFSAAPADADAEVLRQVDFVSHYAGGRGAIREIAELVMKAQGKWFFPDTSGKQHKLDKALSDGRRVLEIESRAVASLVDRLTHDKSAPTNQFQQAVKILADCHGKVVVTGMGKSGLIARKIAATLSSTGTPADFLHPAEGVHGDLGMVSRKDVVIVLSKSGQTDEITLLLPFFKLLNLPIIGLLGTTPSPLATGCDVVLNVSVVEEACPFDLSPTASSTAALAMGDALAVALLNYKGFTKEDFATFHPGGVIGRRLLLKISNLMHSGKEIPMVRENTPLKDVIVEMTSKRLGVTCVLDENDHLTGIITDGDLRRLLKRTTDLANVVAGDFATRSPKTVNSDALATRAIHMMETYKITQLVVLDGNGKLEGMVHLHDLLQAGIG